MEILNRLNRVFLLSLLCVFVVGCKKRERLTNSTFAFRVSPSAAAVEPGNQVNLTAVGPGAEETVWSVFPDTAGAVSPSLGASVQFTAGLNIGQALVTATLGDSMARTQIGVVDYVGSPTSETKFDVYTDQGLPRPPLSSDIDVGGLTIEEISTEFTPEGLKYLSATTNAINDFWDVTLDDNASGQSKNLSSFSPGGSIKFFIRINRTMVNGLNSDRFTVEFKDTGNLVKFRASNSNWTGFDSTLINQWQDVTILLGNFGGPGGFNFAAVKVPFSIKISAWTTGLGPLTFDIDGVRWEQ